MKQTPLMIDELMGLLEPFGSPDLELTPGAVKRLTYPEMQQFHKFLTSSTNKYRTGVDRPEHDANMAAMKYGHHYRDCMVNYIAQWTEDVTDWAHMLDALRLATPSMLEATANYLEHAGQKADLSTGDGNCYHDTKNRSQKISTLLKDDGKNLGNVHVAKGGRRTRTTDTIL